MVRVERIDRVQVRLDGKVHRDKQGFARVWGRVVHANALLDYEAADGEDAHTEFVPESTVNDPAAIASLMFAPITSPHPPEMLDASNTHRYQVGTVVDVKFEDGVLWAEHLFTDATVLDRIDSGVFELSPGYTAELEETPGRFDGREYKKIQRGRLYNHQSVVEDARAGPQNRLLIDSKRAATGLRIQASKDERKPMKKITVNDEEFDVEDAVAAEMARLQGTTDETPEEMAAAAAAAAEAEEAEENVDAGTEEEDGKADDAKGVPAGLAASKTATDGLAAILTKIDGIEDRVVVKLDAQQKTRRAAATKARTDAKDAYSEAKAALPHTYKWDGKSAAQIMRDAIVTQSPDLKARADAAMKEPERLRGMFESEMARKPKTDGHQLGDQVPEGEAKDLWTQRKDAAGKANRQFKVLGNEAMRHESVIAAGGK